MTEQTSGRSLEAVSPPTLETVAELAGVSRATASRVLRGATNVSPQAKAAVEAAAEELSYSPNQAARSLVTRRSDTIAFHIDETEDRIFNDPFFLGMLRSAHARVAAAGMHMMLSVASSASDRRRFLNYAAGGHVDGVLLMSLHGDDDLPERLEAAGVPTVLSGRPLRAHSRLYAVDVDNVGGAAMATTYLFDSGRSRVATVTGPLDMCAGQDRLAGYERAAKQAGAEPHRMTIAGSGFTLATGFDATSRLLDEEPGIDAIFAASDLIAIGAMQAIERTGRRVGRDVAVVGFDDIDQASVTHPALTTVRQPVAELGRTMTDLLLHRLAGEDAQRRELLPVELVLRESA